MQLNKILKVVRKSLKISKIGDNQAFFLPTIMFFLLLFSLLLVFSTVHNLTTIFLVRTAEQEVYYEVAVLEAKQTITNYVQEKKKFTQVCEQELPVKKTANYELMITPLCFLTTNMLITKLTNKLVLPKKVELQIPEKAYEKAVANLKIIEKIELTSLKKLKKKLTKSVNKAANKNLEAKLIVEGAKSKFHELTEQQIAFAIEIKLPATKAKFAILYFYDYEHPQKSKLYYV